MDYKASLPKKEKQLADLRVETNLTEKELAILYGELNQKKRGALIAYLLWFFTGWPGLYFFYLNRPIEGCTRLFMCIAYAIYLLITSSNASRLIEASTNSMLIIICTPLSIVIWWLIDVFLIPGMVVSTNAKAKEKIIDDLIEARERNARD